MMFLLLACAQKDGAAKDGIPDTDDTASERASVVTSTVFDAKSDREGYATISVDVAEGTDIFQVVVKRDSGMLSTDYLYGPGDTLVLDWEDWYDSSFSLTECFFPLEFATTLNWPVRASDGPLEAGTWTVEVATLDAEGYYVGRQDVQVEVLTRSEPDATSGTLHAVIAYANGVREEDGVVEAVEEAVTYWGEIYAGVGIALEAEYSDIDVSAALPDTYNGLDEIREFHEARGDRFVLVVIGELIARDSYLYGEAGGIPGPYTSANHAGVEVSWLVNAGPDATFQTADVQIMGETMAHEVGHYLGLFHPVEDGFEYWDALDDTEACRSYTSCEGAMGTNLMFPYPVCTGMSSQSCVRQGELSGDQGGVMQRYVGIE